MAVLLLAVKRRLTPDYRVLPACAPRALTKVLCDEEPVAGAVERILGEAASKATMSSTKSATGHLLGAAGAIEAAFSCLAIRDQIAPPTINLDNPAIETEMDLVPHKAKPMKIQTVMSNSFGFGGTNAAVVLKKVS